MQKIPDSSLYPTYDAVGRKDDSKEPVNSEIDAYVQQVFERTGNEMKKTTRARRTSYDPSFMEKIQTICPSNKSLQKSSTSEFISYFKAPNIFLNQTIRCVRSPLNCNGIPIYSVRLGNELINIFLNSVYHWGSDICSSIVKEALPALKNKHFDLLDATPRKLLVDLCEKKRDSYNRSLLVNALIQHLPLESVSKAKVVASYFVLYCRFMECLFPGVPIRGSVDKYSLEHIREWMQDQDVSQIENLDLSCSYIEVLPVEIFSRLQNIKTLNFSSNNTFSKLIIESIKILSSLEELDLSNNSFNSIPLTVFDELPFLKKVDLRDNPLRTEELESIKAYFGNRSEVELLI